MSALPALQRRHLVLASASPVRAAILRAAGLVAEVVPSGVDEAPIKRSLAPAGPEALSAALAAAKAERVAERSRDALVIGADQVLVVDGEILDKPADASAARARLRALRGRAHRLVTSVAVAGGGETWRHTEAAELVMRRFSDSCADACLAAAGPDATATVGAYALEGVGVHLFERVDGDWFAILGLPLMPLLAHLRARGAVVS